MKTLWLWHDFHISGPLWRESMKRFSRYWTHMTKIHRWFHNVDVLSLPELSIGRASGIVVNSPTFRYFHGLFSNLVETFLVSRPDSSFDRGFISLNMRIIGPSMAFTIMTWHSWALPGARPTNGISIKFEIRSKFGGLWFKTCSIDHNEILHTPWLMTV